MKRLVANLPIIMLSLIIAITLWFVVMSTTNPWINGFVNVAVTVENEDYIHNQNKTPVFDPKIVKVYYLARNNEQAIVKQSDFRAYIDLKDLDSTSDLTVHVEALNGVDSYVTNIEAEPNTLHVVLDDVARHDFAIKYDIKGDVRDGHSVGNVILSPNIVYISGSNEKINNISRVLVEIPVNNHEETFSGLAAVRVIDKEGRHMPMEGLSLSAQEVNYTVVVNSRANISVNAVVEGNVKTGYTYAGVQVTPNNIIVNGPRSILQNYYNQDLPIINIDGLDHNVEMEFATKDILPPGITSNVETIKVNVTINSNVLNRSKNDFVEVGPHMDNGTEEETEMASNESESVSKEE